MARRPTATSTGAGSPAPDAAACARQVLDTVPAVMDALRLAMRREVGDELSVPQFRALAFVDRTRGCAIGDVASFLGVTLPTASALVDRLSRAGLLDVGADPADRRRACLRLTDAGQVQLARIRDGAEAVFARALQACPPDDLARLDAGLAVLRRLLPAA